MSGDRVEWIGNLCHEATNPWLEDGLLLGRTRRADGCGRELECQQGHPRHNGDISRARQFPSDATQQLIAHDYASDNRIGANDNAGWSYCRELCVSSLLVL